MKIMSCLPEPTQLLASPFLEMVKLGKLQSGRET